MCGIAGLIERAGAGRSEPAALAGRCRRMVDALAHRGPDGRAVAARPGLALGHARLAVVDLSPAAAQPMASADGHCLITFNGEVYNHPALRRELEAQGHVFRTRGDTEVLLAAYQAWGPSFVERLNGIFALALHDAPRRCLLLARDRLGVKPLYWRRTAGAVAFGSEVKALAAAGLPALEVDGDGLLEFLAFQNHLGRRTLFRDIELFPAGHVALVDTADLTVRERRYWSARIHARPEDPAAARERLDAVLQRAVQRQLQADVPVNAFLSGGIDSGAIAALATRTAGRLQTFTCGFGLDGVTGPERAFDERLAAEQVAAHLASEHYETVLHADDFLARMHDWAWHAEEPRVGSSFPNFCVAGLASRFSKVCLSGTGGDELFGGYPWRYRAAWEAPDWDAFVRQYHRFWHRLVPPSQFAALAAPLGPHRFDSLAALREGLDGARARVVESGRPWADAALLFEAGTFLQGLLVVEDKASMAHGLEVRVPLLDDEVVDLALVLPVGLKLAATSPGAAPHEGKRILREVLARHVPPQVAAAPKQGFSPPFESWFRQGLRGWLDGEVFGPGSCLRDVVDLRVARATWGEHLQGGANHRLFVWGMASLYLALTSFLGRTR